MIRPLALLALLACSGPPTAPEVAGSYVGQFVMGTLADQTYPIEVEELDAHTVAVRGDDFDALEIGLQWSGSLITDDGRGDVTLSYSGDTLDLTSTDITFQGSRADGEPGDTPTGEVDPQEDPPTEEPAEDGCSVVVPATAQLLTEDSGQAADNLDVVVCPGSSLNGSGSAMRIYALAGSTVNVSGSDNHLWATGNAIATLVGTGNAAIAEPGSTAVLTGTDGGSTECARVTIDTSELPGGC